MHLGDRMAGQTPTLPLRRRRRTRGQSLVEFALVLPIFMLLLAGMVDFGLGLYSYMTIINAAREGGRLAATNCTATDCTGSVQTKTAASSNGILTTSLVSVTCYTAATPPASEVCSASQPGDSVTVSTTGYAYKMIWPLTFGTQIPMQSSVTFMLE
jgi:Flp pilus assembly protein TadG